MNPTTFTRLLLVIFMLVLQGIPLSQNLPIDGHLNSWTLTTLPQGHYANIHQIQTPYGDGISIDTIGYPGAFEYLYDFLAYYKQPFIVPATGAVEIRGYFYYNDDSYIVSPSRKFIAVYILQSDLSAIIATTRILDYENGELPDVWYYRRVIMQNLEPGQKYYLAFGRYDYFAYERYLQASWAAVDLAPPHLIRVPQDFATIREAINNATDGDIIRVASGVYHESLIINKGVNLIGENRANTIIDTNQSGAAIFVMAQNVTITGFTIKNSNQDIGLLLTSSQNTKITQNTIITGQCGISLQNSNNTLIIKNRMINNGIGIQIASGSTNNTIYHNDFINNTQQIEIDPASNNRWDNDFEEGNYWSDYSGEDQNRDGIGDTMLPWQTVDNYPLLNPYIEGDVNHNGVVDIVDVTLLAMAWQTTKGQPNYNIHADFNMDNTINIIDATTIGRNWLRRNP